MDNKLTMMAENRRIDEVGRVVIPPEVRRELNINASDPLDIYIYSDGENRGIFLKKNPNITLYWNYIEEVVGFLVTCFDLPVIITDKDKITGCSRHISDYNNKALSNELKKLIHTKSNSINTGQIQQEGDELNCTILEGFDCIPLYQGDSNMYQSQLIYKVYNDKKIVGSIVMMSTNRNVRLGELEKRVIIACANIYKKRFVYHAW